MLWMPFQRINKQTKLMMMREFVEMRANNDPHFPRRISNEPLCSKLNLCLTLFPGTIPGSYTRAVINVPLFLRNFFKVNSLNKTLYLIQLVASSSDFVLVMGSISPYETWFSFNWNEKIKTLWIRKENLGKQTLWCRFNFGQGGSCLRKAKGKKSPWNMVGENFHPVNDLRAFADKPH